jgi:Nitroreductase family
MITRRQALAAGAGAIAVGFGGYWAVNRGPSYDEAVKFSWVKKTPKSDADFGYLVHYATLAANSHNTQPWLFRKIAERVAIRPDFSRSTPIVDPDGHHLFASLGCAAENLILAANAAGKAAALTFDETGDGRIEIDLAGNAARDPLFDAILERQCTRSEYDGQPVSNEDLDALVKAAKVDGCELFVIPEKSRIEQALELVVAANTIQVMDSAFTDELRSWLRFSAANAIATGDGLYASCSGNPTMPQWLGNIVFGFVFKPQSENDRYAKQIRSSSGLAVFATEKNDKEHWVQAGRSYQRFALKAASMGIRHAFINQPVEVAPVRTEFSKWLGMSGGRPDLVIRYGHAPVMPKSLRRPIKDVIIQD